MTSVTNTCTRSGTALGDLQSACTPIRSSLRNVPVGLEDTKNLN